MEEKNPMPIRKFSLIGIIALSLIIFSLIGAMFNFTDELITTVQTYVILISQTIGNILFGVALLGYFLHLKENKILKWTSLFIGIFYIINFFTVNNFFSLFSDKFGLIETFSKSAFFYIYSFMVGVDLIFFGYAFSKLGRSNKLIGVLAVIFIASSVYVTSINLVTTHVTSLLNEINLKINDIIIKDMLAKYKYINVLSYASLLGIFITLYVGQKSEYTKTFKVKIENLIDETE